MNGKVLQTITYPIKYQGILCPKGVLNLSDKYPTSGVHRESTTCPTKNVKEAALVSAIVTKKNKEKLNS